MNKILLVAAISYLASGCGQPGDLEDISTTPVTRISMFEAGAEPEAETPLGDDDPVIHESEVSAPPLDWKDAGWEPGPWFDDPETVDCRAAPSWCQSEIYKDAVEAKAEAKAA